MKHIFWFFREGEALYEDQCLRALNEGRIVETVPYQYWDFEGKSTRKEYDEMIASLNARPFIVIDEKEWRNLVAEANAKQMDIVNDSKWNLPMLAERGPSVKDELEEAREEHRACREWFRILGGHDDMAIKCAVLGLDFKTKYPTLYAEGIRKRARINELEATYPSLADLQS